MSEDKTTTTPESDGRAAGSALSASSGSARPNRRVEVQIKVGADSFDDLLQALDEIITEIGMGQTDCVSGGCSSGYHFKVTEDESVTHESYFRALKEFQKLRAQNSRDREPGGSAGSDCSE